MRRRHPCRCARYAGLRAYCHRETIVRSSRWRIIAPMQSSPPQTEATDNSSADRLYDLSLRILMVVVSVGLVASVAFLTYRWLAPPHPVQNEVPVVEIGVKPAQAATPTETPA